MDNYNNQLSISDYNQMFISAIMHGYDSEKATQIIEEMKRQEILNNAYKYSYNPNRGRYYGYLPDDTKPNHRRQISSQTEWGIQQQIIDYHNQNKDIVTFKSLFDEWIALKSKALAPSSIAKYKGDYDRLIKNSILENTDIRQIDDTLLNAYITEIAPDITLKTFGNVRTIIMGVFKYSYMNQITDFNIVMYFEKLDSSLYGFMQKRRKIIKYNNDEVLQLINYLKERPSLTPHDIAVYINFYIGCRVGEIASLCIEDIDFDGKAIHIHRTEQRKLVNNKYKLIVSDTPKTEAGDRWIPVNDHVLELIKSVIHDRTEGYVFVGKNGNRIRGNTINKHLELTCKKANINEPISFHSIRRFVATTLHEKGVPDITIASILGHKDIATTKKCYIYDKNDINEKRKYIDSSFDFLL